MRPTKLLLFILFLGTTFSVFAQTGKQSKMYKGYAQQMTRMYFSMLNSLGDPENPISEKEIIVNASFNKLFRDRNVQIEDDLDDNRKVPLFKDVQAYLRDVDFFFKKVTFDYEIQATEILENDKGAPYVKVTVNRKMNGISVKDDRNIINNQIRYLEINIDLAKQELRIASIYTTKINQKEELRHWWNNMPVHWQVLLSSNIEIEDSISDAQIKSIALTEELNISGDSTIQSIEPVSKLLKLKKINISNTGIYDLMPLRNLLNLEVVKCANTPVESVAPLRYAIHLTELDISNTKVSDLSDAVNFIDVKRLNLSNTTITDLAPIAALPKIEDLVLDGLVITDLEFLKELGGLKYIKLANTPIQDIGALRSLTKLEEIDISASKVQDLRPLKYQQNLKKIYLNNTPVLSLTPVSGKNLVRVYCDNTNIDKNEIRRFVDENPETTVIYDSEALEKWWTKLSERLKTKLMDEAGLTEVPTVEQLHKISEIKRLDLTSFANFSKLSQLEMLSRLQYLNISQTKVQDLSVLEHFTDLVELQAAFIPVSDIRPLQAQKKLQVLNLANTQVSDLSPLSGAINLEKLSVEQTNVKSLQALLALPALKLVNADGNGITDKDQLIESRPEVLVVYKTQVLKTWYKRLPDEWKEVFAGYAKLDSDPTAKQLHKVASLTKLEIKSNHKLRDLQPIIVLNGLKELTISDTQLSSLEPLQKLGNLKMLSITQSPVSHISALAALKGLSYLDVSNTPVADLSAVSSLRKLETLKFNGTQVSDLEPLVKLRGLKELEFYNTPAKKLKPLYSLTRLETIKCYNTKTTQRRVDKLQKALRKTKIIFYGGSTNFLDDLW